MRPSIENSYISHLDRHDHSASQEEIEEQGLLAEELVIEAINSNLPGFNARLSSHKEDSGKKDIGQRQTIDAVAYKDGRPAIGIQITTAEDPKIRQHKMMEIMNQPFLRLDEMKNSDLAIPKVLVYLKREMVKHYKEEPDFSKDPEVLTQVLDGIVKSLQFDLTRTKNQQEKSAIQKLILDLQSEKKKLTH